ncbi:MAG: SIMPL domain-containing protein, partial [Arenimonas sp.]
MNRSTLKTALIQDVNHGDAAENLAVIEQRVAEAAAAGARRSVEAVLRIEESGAVMAVRSAPMAVQVGRMQDAVAATPVSMGEIEVRAQVTVTA